jgi:hypothetical protein
VELKPTLFGGNPRPMRTSSAVSKGVVSLEHMKLHAALMKDDDPAVLASTTAFSCPMCASLSRRTPTCNKCGRQRLPLRITDTDCGLYTRGSVSVWVVPAYYDRPSNASGVQGVVSVSASDEPVSGFRFVDAPEEAGHVLAVAAGETTRGGKFARRVLPGVSFPTSVSRQVHSKFLLRLFPEFGFLGCVHPTCSPLHNRHMLFFLFLQGMSRPTPTISTPRFMRSPTSYALILLYLVAFRG